MARFNAQDIDNYGGQGGGGFFGLRDDRDTAIVRFMYEHIDDIEGFSVHEVEVDGKRRYVDCLREYDQPVDDCPLCAARQRVVAKMFIPIFNEDTGEVQIWDRGRTFYSKISSLASRYEPLVSTPFEIERNGRRGDTSTTYETYAMETDDTLLADLPEVPNIVGTIILDKTYEELEFYLANGYFEDEESQPVERSQRRPAQDRPARRQPQARPARRVEAAPVEEEYVEEAPTQRPRRARRTPSHTDRF